MEIEIPKIEQSIVHSPQVNQNLNPQERKEIQYRWIILILMGLALILNGLMNNAIAPLEHKITLLYEVSQSKVSFSMVISFLVFFPASFPAIKVLDSKGIRIAMIYGTFFYFAGTLFYSLINRNYNLVLLGSFLIGIGQPFILNSLFKVPIYWFFPKNRVMITSVLIACSFFGLMLGFLIPPLIVQEENQLEGAKVLLSHLYLSYFIISGVILILCLLFMNSKPQFSPSEEPIQRTYSLKESFYQIKNNKNLWMFFSGCFLGEGTIICLAINLNFIIKLYGYEDLEIAIAGLFMIFFGIIGAFLFIIYIRKTLLYKISLGFTCLGTAFFLGILCLWLNSFNGKAITTILLSLLSLIAAPIIPICYDLGCELAFPMGETLATVIINGTALLQAFFLSLFVTSVFGFQSESSSILILGFFSILLIFSAIFFLFVKIDLKKRQYKKEQNQLLEGPFQKYEINKEYIIDPPKSRQSQELSQTGDRYRNLQEENEEPRIDVQEEK